MAGRDIRRISLEDAERVAIRALGFLAGEPERLDRFLALTGIDVASLRAAAAEPAFLGHVLGHIASDEPLLLAFAANEAMEPAMVAAALMRLDGPPVEL
jgi:hypothetical protein